MLDKELSLMSNMAKQSGAAELQRRITDVCIGLDADGWAYHTGRVFGQFMGELQAEEKRLKDLMALPEKE